MRGKSPKVGPKPDAINAGPKPDAGQSPKVGSKPDVGLEPDAVNAGPEPDARPKPNTVDAGPEPDVGPKPNKVGRPSVHSSPCHGERVKAAGGLPAKVGMTRRSCGVGGRVGRPLVIARLAMER
ncbi:hypothetical protein CRG98_018673 [Punica granatum]|uniref:Uncharacterized protein n=1 Tax=Punica granatum TaxID=22663 RepID=A0A2I0JX85_PUNGR|nr:hypothetical protein CRG98_018673 [Punica granatum]